MTWKVYSVELPGQVSLDASSSTEWAELCPARQLSRKILRAIRQRRGRGAEETAGSSQALMSSAEMFKVPFFFSALHLLRSAMQRWDIASDLRYSFQKQIVVIHYTV